MIVLHDLTHGTGWLDVGTAEHRDAWLPKIGPTAYLLALELSRTPETSTPEAEQLARRLGVSPKTLSNALRRLEHVGHIEQLPDAPSGHPVYSVRLAVRTPRDRRGIAA